MRPLEVWYHHHIDSSVGSVVLGLRIEAQQFEYDEKHILIVQLQVACQFVGAVGKETLKSFEKSIRIALADVFDEAHNLERRIARLQMGIAGQQELRKAFFHLFIGES